MSEQSFLVPANSKRARLIFGFFRPIDLGIFIAGIAITLVLLMVSSVADIKNVILIILPVCIAGMLVFPLPNYHNVLTFIMSAWTFFTTRRNFIWKGWCVLDEEETTKK